MRLRCVLCGIVSLILALFCFPCRSVAHYNIHHEEIIESTANPFFATCMYILFLDAQRMQREHANDRAMFKRMKDSQIHKRTIMQVLFNSKK